MPNQQERRSGRAGVAPTGMMQAVGGMAKWKLNVMFVVGLVGMGLVSYWFAFYEHDGKIELIVGAIMFLIFAFFAFPLGITRLADKYVPDKWRKERRGGP